MIKKVYDMKKVFSLSWKTKTFFSSIQQVLGNSRNRHNDLFGMTIFQFGREYKACLERRKENGILILFYCSNSQQLRTRENPRFFSQTFGQLRKFAVFRISLDHMTFSFGFVFLTITFRSCILRQHGFKFNSKVAV